jgi:hypothetical protein
MSSDTLFIKRNRPNTKTITVSKTRPADTTTYAVGDTISESSGAGTVWTFPGFAREAGKGGTLVGASLIISTDQSIKLDSELWLFDAAPTTTLNDNVAWAPTDAEMKTLLGIVFFPAALWKAGSGNGCVDLDALSKAFQCVAAGSAIYGVLRAANAYVPTSGEEITIRLHVAQD